MIAQVGCTARASHIIIGVIVNNQSSVIHRTRRWIPSPRSCAFVVVLRTICAVIAFGGVSCRGADDVLTPHRVAVLRQVTSAVISPDGSRIAYTLSVPRNPNVERDGELGLSFGSRTRAEAQRGRSSLAK